MHQDVDFDFFLRHVGGGREDFGARHKAGLGGHQFVIAHLETPGHFICRVNVEHPGHLLVGFDQITPLLSGSGEIHPHEGQAGHRHLFFGFDGGNTEPHFGKQFDGLVIESRGLLKLAFLLRRLGLDQCHAH